MKKFSTAATLLALASIFLPLTGHASAADEARVDPSSVNCTFKKDAPDQHTVVKGDTLWGISGQFLDHPWCWPQVWGLNRDEIKNPHWIYPGQIVYFDRAAGRLRLGTPISTPTGGTSDNHMGPQTRTSALAGQAIASIPASAIEPYLSKPLIVSATELNSVPRIIATQDGRVNVGKGDHAYVRGPLNDETSFQLFRPSRPLKDPDTKQIIGYEAVYLGTARVTKLAKTDDTPSTIEVTEAKEEMSVGDRLLPVPLTPFINYVPHAPAGPVQARIVSIYEGVNNAGQNQIVTINRGRRDGVDVGTVLQLYSFGATIKDKTDNNKMIKLPDEEYGSLFVFRVFEGISYALIMEVRDSVQVGDVAKTPE
jgi:hypothetical protein